METQINSANEFFFMLFRIYVNFWLMQKSFAQTITWLNPVEKGNTNKCFSRISNDHQQETESRIKPETQAHKFRSQKLWQVWEPTMDKEKEQNKKKRTCNQRKALETYYFPYYPFVFPYVERERETQSEWMRRRYREVCQWSAVPLIESLRHGKSCCNNAT